MHTIYALYNIPYLSVDQPMCIYVYTAGKVLEDDVQAIINLFEENGFAASDLSGNEMAKAHVRHLAGMRCMLYSV